jgi:hypothetical protein
VGLGLSLILLRLWGHALEPVLGGVIGLGPRGEARTNPKKPREAQTDLLLLHHRAPYTESDSTFSTRTTSLVVARSLTTFDLSASDYATVTLHLDTLSEMI